MGGGGGTAGLAPRFGGKTMLGHTFVLVELLDPTDSQYFKQEMKKKGLKDLTPQSNGNTFRSKRPTEDWMMQVAKLDPDWWYISGHFARTPDYEELKEDQQREKVIIPLFPKKTESWNVTIETTNFIKQGGWASQRFPTTSFGLKIKTQRKIEILVENEKYSGNGETSIISVEPYADPIDRYIYKETKRMLAGSGTISEQEQWEWKTVKIGGKLCYQKHLMSKPKAFLEKLAKLESYETPFCFPENYPVEVKQSGYVKFINDKNQPETRPSVDLIFKSSETIDNSIGYCVSSQWEIDQTVWDEPDNFSNRNLKWNNPRNHAQIIEYIKAGRPLFQPLYERFVFSEINNILLEDGWKTQYDYPIIELAMITKVGDREEGTKKCPDDFLKTSDGRLWSRFHPKSHDEIKASFLKRWVDRAQDASFFNKSYYDNEYQSKLKSSPESWRIQMEYAFTRNDLKANNFLEEHGPGSYSNAKAVLLVSCNTLALASVREYLTQLFPNAIFLGHVHKNPKKATPIIKHFLAKYFGNMAKARAYDWQHMVSSWLSYDDAAKHAIMARGYGLAGLYKGNVYGIDVDNSYNTSTPLAKKGETIQRLRLKSIEPPSGCKQGCTVDVLLVWDSKGKLVTHRGIYEGEGKLTDFNIRNEYPYNNTSDFPRLTAENLLRNRGY
jgi:hypothetical protein